MQIEDYVPSFQMSSTQHRNVATGRDTQGYVMWANKHLTKNELCLFF